MLDLNLRTISMLGLISKNYHFLEKKKQLLFFTKLAYDLWQDFSCINFLVPGAPENMIHFENSITFDSTEINA